MKTIILACALLLSARPLIAVPTATESYVAHEWGTFTSVQGIDGVQMFWNPLNVLELPGFVYTLTRPAPGRPTGVVSVSKTAFVTRQRMETPVIYFYSERPVTLDVAVDFPEGTMTEWFPHARFAEELLSPVLGKIGKKNTLRWQNISIIPNRGDLCDDASALPREAKGSHYYAARETDSALLQVETGGDKREREKFLFYRGVGSFEAPLVVKPADDDATTILLTNRGGEELRHLFAYEVRGDRAKWMTADSLPPNEHVTLNVGDAGAISPEELRRTLGEKLRAALVAEGLYAREADAMVKTWDDSWFAEQGVRVLYTLPRAWTDRTLPLRLAPAARSVERVMVGRAEIITPAMERAVAREVQRYVAGDDAARVVAVENMRTLGLGRFAEAAMRRVLTSGKRSREFSAGSWELLAAASNAPAR